MRYYKIIQDNNFIGIINSNNFIAYQNINHMFVGANEETGDLVACNNKLYRDYWMKPFNNSINRPYEFANIIEITYEEYITFKNAIDSQKEIIVEDDNYIAPSITPVIPPEEGIDYIRSTKISEMSRACNRVIENGFDVEIEGETHHFSLTVQDQLNLITLSSMAAQGVQQIPYHADGELCKFYTAAEINTIVNQATMFKTYHTTYYNALKAYINSLETIEEIGAITYGVELPEEFQTDVLRAITQ